MIIPKEAIELAQKGGWLGVDLPSDIYFHWSEKRYAGNYRQAAHALIALDRDFWIAIGKVKGWSKGFIGSPESERENPALVNVWKVNARRFYNLILSQQPTDTFWTELLEAK